MLIRHCRVVWTDKSSGKIMHGDIPRNLIFGSARAQSLFAVCDPGRPFQGAVVARIKNLQTLYVRDCLYEIRVIENAVVNVRGEPNDPVY